MTRGPVPAATARRGPIYQQIADELRARIISGCIPRGGKLPTEAELSEHHGVAQQRSPPTIRNRVRVGPPTQLPLAQRVVRLSGFT